MSAELQHEYKSTSAFYLWRSEDSLKLIQAEWEAVLEIFDVCFVFFFNRKNCTARLTIRLKMESKDQTAASIKNKSLDVSNNRGEAENPGVVGDRRTDEYHSSRCHHLI